MTFELAPMSEFMTYEDAILYCFFLSHNGHKDWRMPTFYESHSTRKIYGWYQDDPESRTNKKYPVVPVRTKHDS